MKRRIEFDIWYIENANLLLDAKILFWTVKMELTCRTDIFQ